MKNNFLLRNPIKLAFVISIFYWIYLALNSKMAISCDAIEYEYLGRTIFQKGWMEYFKTGPNNEPFYPALIAFSMWIARISGASYQSIQILLQLSILFLTQILTLGILRLLKISNLLCALTILYLGISPAIVNSAFSLFSEIITYPLILVIVLLSYRSWLSFAGSRRRVILLAIITGLLFAAMILIKGIFELITPVFFLLFLLYALSTRNRKLIVNALIYLVVFFMVFYSLVNSYKSINKVLNGSFVITNRGDWALYGNTARRMEPLTGERFLTALAYTPGENVCKSVFGEEKCRFWSFWVSDKFGRQKENELRAANMPTKAVHNSLILLSMQKALDNPGQYILLTALEGAKMFFWESTKIGFVAYPAGLEKLFNWTPFKDGLRLAVSLLTLLAFFYLAALLWLERKNILKKDAAPLFLFLCFLFILSYIISYALFMIVTRYALPITPLYLIIISYVLQKRCFPASGH